MLPSADRDLESEEFFRVHLHFAKSRAKLVQLPSPFVPVWPVPVEVRANRSWFPCLGMRSELRIAHGGLGSCLCLLDVGSKTFHAIQI